MWFQEEVSSDLSDNAKGYPKLADEQWSKDLYDAINEDIDLLFKDENKNESKLKESIRNYVFISLYMTIENNMKEYCDNELESDLNGETRFINTLKLEAYHRIKDPLFKMLIKDSIPPTEYLLTNGNKFYENSSSNRSELFRKAEEIYDSHINNNQKIKFKEALAIAVKDFPEHEKEIKEFDKINKCEGQGLKNFENSYYQFRKRNKSTQKFKKN